MNPHYTIELGWLRRELLPNVKSHHFKKSKAVKATRLESRSAFTKALGGDKPPLWDCATASVIFYEPDLRRRDTDNFL